MGTKEMSLQEKKSMNEKDKEKDKEEQFIENLRKELGQKVPNDVDFLKRLLIFTPDSTVQKGKGSARDTKESSKSDSDDNEDKHKGKGIFNYIIYKQRLIVFVLGIVLFITAPFSLISYSYVNNQLDNNRYSEIEKSFHRRFPGLLSFDSDGVFRRKSPNSLLSQRYSNFTYYGVSSIQRTVSNSFFRSVRDIQFTVNSDNYYLCLLSINGDDKFGFICKDDSNKDIFIDSIEPFQFSELKEYFLANSSENLLGNSRRLNDTNTFLPTGLVIEIIDSNSINLCSYEYDEELVIRYELVQ